MGLQRGSFRVALSQNGKRLRLGLPFYGFMGNVRQCPALMLLKAEIFSFS
jgi:hypothetical protein